MQDNIPLVPLKRGLPNTNYQTNNPSTSSSNNRLSNNLFQQQPYSILGNDPVELYKNAPTDSQSKAIAIQKINALFSFLRNQGNSGVVHIQEIIDIIIRFNFCENLPYSELLHQETLDKLLSMLKYAVNQSVHQYNIGHMIQNNTPNQFYNYFASIMKNNNQMFRSAAPNSLKYIYSQYKDLVNHDILHEEILNFVNENFTLKSKKYNNLI